MAGRFVQFGVSANRGGNTCEGIQGREIKGNKRFPEYTEGTVEIVRKGGITMDCKTCQNYNLYLMIVSKRPYQFCGDIPCLRCSRFTDKQDEYRPACDTSASGTSWPCYRTKEQLNREEKSDLPKSDKAILDNMPPGGY